MKTYTIYGFGITLASAIITLLLLATGFLTNPEKLGTAFLILILCGLIVTTIGIVMVTKAVRTAAGNQGLTYGQAWQAAFFTMIIAAVFGALFNVVYFTYLNPNYNEVAVEWTRSMMESRGVSSEKIDRQIDEMTKKGTVNRQVLNGVIFTIAFGSVIALVTSAIMKRPPVEDLTQVPPPIG